MPFPTVFRTMFCPEKCQNPIRRRGVRRPPHNLEVTNCDLKTKAVLAASGTESQWMSSKGKEVLQYRREIPMHDPSKRIALVTGANKGIGFEIARGLGKAGLIVLLGARDTGLGEEVATT